jgi:CelD/BcsL family acetyltransferase involved in cellulose biosynthesis
MWRSCEAPYVKLTGSFDSYFQSLRSKLRANLRRRLKGLSQVGRVGHEVVRSGDQLQTALEEGLRIEAASWKGNEGTAIRCSPEVHRFYSKIAEISAQRGWLWLDFLTVNNRRVAFDYCLRYHNKHYLLKTGYDPKFAQYSPSHLLLWRVLQTMFENRVEEFDFVGINDSWKQDWSGDTRPHYWLYLFPNQIRMRLIHGLKFHLIPRLRQHRFIAALRGARAGR